MNCDTVIISDLHLGSPFSHVNSFRNFIRQLPESSCLVLNGDTVDFRRDFSDTDRAVIQDFSNKARNSRVVWIRGNHDRDYTPPEPDNIEFTESFRINDGIFAAHGHSFDPPRFCRRMLTPYFRFRYNLYRRLGGRPMHVAEYAKRFRGFYKAFKTRLARNAAAYANNHGFKALVCGHTHSVDDTMVDGIRFLNTGSWTERDAAFVHIHNGTLELKRLSVSQHNITPSFQS